jgi:HD-like signal output (HDOD) protein
MAECRINIETLNQKIETDFPLPQTLVKMMDALNNPDANIARLENILKSDPGFSLKLLSMANSAFYGSMSRIGNIHSAITLLGFNTIKNLAVQMSVSQCLAGVKPNPYFSFETLWKHSIGVAVCSKMLARRLKLGNAEDFFTMGILHDIGLLIESQFCPEQLIEVFEHLAKGEKTLTEIEEEILGVSHAQVTTLLCKKWSLPADLAAALQFHHTPMEAPEEHKRSACAVYLADKIVMRAEFGFLYARGEEWEPAVLALFELEPVDAEVVLEDFQEQANEFLPLLSGK